MMLQDIRIEKFSLRPARNVDIPERVYTPFRTVSSSR
mgnify:CR=1 FL=1